MPQTSDSINIFQKEHPYTRLKNNKIRRTSCVYLSAIMASTLLAQKIFSTCHFTAENITSLQSIVYFSPRLNTLALFIPPGHGSHIYPLGKYAALDFPSGTMKALPYSKINLIHLTL